MQRTAREIGTTANILSNLANGRTKAESHPEVLAALRRRFRKPESWPFSNVSTQYDPDSFGESVVPYVGIIDDGTKVNWRHLSESVELEVVPSAMSAPGRVAARIAGDSMYDVLQQGDLCVFHSHQAPRLGLIVLYRRGDGTGTVKELRHDGRRFTLNPVNPAYQPVAADGECLGYLVGIVRKWGSREMTLYDPNGIGI